MKISFKLGDVFEINLVDGVYVYARILKDSVISVQSTISNCKNNPPNDYSNPVLITGFNFLPVEDGTYPIVTNVPFENEDDAWAPPQKINENLIYYRGKTQHVKSGDAKGLYQVKVHNQVSLEKELIWIFKLRSDQTKEHELFLSKEYLVDMFKDDFYPNELVLKLCRILEQFEKRFIKGIIKNSDDMYFIAQILTSRINKLSDEFFVSGSEIETVARELITSEFVRIAVKYGYTPDVEKLISTRDS